MKNYYTLLIIIVIQIFQISFLQVINAQTISGIITDINTKEALIVDPSESKPIIEFINKKKLNLNGILITHHHSDHTSGIEDLLSFKNVSLDTFCKFNSKFELFFCPCKL